MVKNTMKAIILAAGMGTRLGKYTENLPKCMLEFHGQPLLQQQIETLRKAGLSDISVVRGYNAEKIQIPGVKYYHNPDFATTNMVETLFCAEKEMDGSDDILVCYADILYEPRILNLVLKSNADVGVTVDEDYEEYWRARMENPEEDMESLVIERGKIVELGDTKCTRDQAKVRYVGLIKFSRRGIKKLKEVYHHHKNIYYHLDQPWLRSKSFKKAYMTCMLQALINAGQEVNPIILRRGWLEFDTVEDYERYSKWLKEGTIARFIMLPTR